MNALLPAFVDRLLDQGRDPGEIPQLPASSATGWLGLLAARILSVPDTGTRQPADAFLAHSYVHLPFPAPGGRAIYLRLASHSAMEPWPVLTTSVVLTVAGTVTLEMYEEAADSRAGRTQYARSFGPEQVFAVHPGTHCSTQSSPDGVQVLATASTSPRLGTSLTGDEYAAAAQRARWVLDGLAHGAPAGDHR
ncbi:hypothetical protein ACFYW6_38400 [Streptomyces sp. NPDC002659]|uniref:hypothetical protein n=1 Tax=Streptomyces sp. NPDC002659 TaxID=3364656 RepID=UPI0036748BCF